MKQRRPYQKVLIAIAFICYFVGVLVGISAFYFGKGGQDPVTASLMASVVFFFGVGIVLQAIGSANLPSLKFDK
ncbi:MAG: hemerythrin family protein [Candidatus Thiodiazotropha sp.]